MNYLLPFIRFFNINQDNQVIIKLNKVKAKVLINTLNLLDCTLPLQSNSNIILKICGEVPGSI